MVAEGLRCEICVRNGTRPRVENRDSKSWEFENLGKGWRAVSLESEEPAAIARHGDAVGYYIPTRQRRSETERTALKEAASRLQQAVTAEGISEEEFLRDFKLWPSASGNEGDLRREFCEG